MDGWLYGLFALAGVIVGGFFTFLGLVKQLGQQKELDSRQWQRKIRSEPLLKLRDELAIMATMQNRVANAAEKLYNIDSDGMEKANIELEEAINDWNTYLSKGNLFQTLLIQYDTELFNNVLNIQKSYITSYHTLRHKVSKRDERDKAIGPLSKVWQNVISAQELINKRLEEL